MERGRKTDANLDTVCFCQLGHLAKEFKRLRSTAIQVFVIERVAYSDHKLQDRIPASNGALVAFKIRHQRGKSHSRKL